MSIRLMVFLARFFLIMKLALLNGYLRGSSLNDRLMRRVRECIGVIHVLVTFYLEEKYLTDLNILLIMILEQEVKMLGFLKKCKKGDVCLSGVMMLKSMKSFPKAGVQKAIYYDVPFFRGIYHYDITKTL